MFFFMLSQQAHNIKCWVLRLCIDCTMFHMNKMDIKQSYLISVSVANIECIYLYAFVSIWQQFFRRGGCWNEYRIIVCWPCFVIRLYLKNFCDGNWKKKLILCHNKRIDLVESQVWHISLETIASYDICI